MSTQRPMITWTHAKLEVFKERYRVASELGRMEFKFEGHDIYTPFAKYLIEYVEGRLSLGRN